VVRHRPPQVIIWVHDEPVGQGEPPTVQGVAKGADERMARKNMVSILVDVILGMSIGK
jgi:hypothetical protein